MLFLGHASITLGLGLLLDSSLRKKYGSAIGETSVVTRKTDTIKKPTIANPPLGTIAKVAVFMRRMDYRLLILGSLLPDIIDKPIGMVFFRDFFSNGRLFSHSLLFLVLITSLGLYLYRRWGKPWLLILSFGTAVHLLLDEMWNTPGTILWPFLGWGFEKKDLTNWFEKMWHSFTASPYVIATEAIGAIIIIAFIVVLVRRKKLYAFIRYGRW